MTCAARGAAAGSRAGSSTTTRSSPTSARRAGRRRSTWWPGAWAQSMPSTAPGAIAGFGSAKCSNEEAYLFQKLIRAGFGTNNVDHCTRLCHASSVAALFEGVGSGAVSTTYGDIINADVAILAGTNTTANHPVAASFFKQAKRRGTTLDRGRPEARTDRGPRGRLLPAQAGHRRCLLQRHPARGHPHGPRGPRVPRRARHELRRARQDRPRVPARARRPDLRRGRGPPQRGRPALGRGRRGGHLLGDGHLPAHHRHGQRPLPDRALLDHRQRGPAGHRAAPAARAEQRPGRLGRGPHPDVLSRLPARDARRRARTLRGGLGARARPRARPHGHRDRGLRPHRRRARDVHDGREPVPVGPEREQGPQGA